MVDVTADYIDNKESLCDLNVFTSLKLIPNSSRLSVLAYGSLETLSTGECPLKTQFAARNPSDKNSVTNISSKSEGSNDSDDIVLETSSNRLSFSLGIYPFKTFLISKKLCYSDNYKPVH
jgi:hypothetical protein